MAEYIDRREVVEAICFNCSEINICAGVCDDIDRIINIPSADVRPVVRGQWIMRGGKFHCSRCDAKALWRREDGTNGFSHEYTQKKSGFCPNCGADLRGGDSE